MRTSLLACHVPKAAVSRCSKPSLDHLVSAREQPRRNFKPERLRGLEIDHKLEFGRLLHRQVVGLLALQNPVNVAGRLPGMVGGGCAMEHPPAAIDEEPKCVGSRKAMPRR